MCSSFLVSYQKCANLVEFSFFLTFLPFDSFWAWRRSSPTTMLVTLAPRLSGEALLMTVPMLPAPSLVCSAARR